MINFVSIMEW